MNNQESAENTLFNEDPEYLAEKETEEELDYQDFIDDEMN